MKVLVACEFSGIVRDAFLARGHDAISCDLLLTEKPGPHIQGDIRDVDLSGFDLLIAHPPCTHLAVSGARWFKEKQAEQIEALEFVRYLLNAPVPRIALENPISIISSRIRKPDQIVQPWMFGHGETKATCLWLKGLPELRATNIVEGREGRVHREPPSPDRWKNRSRTFTGLAEAMADQWGGLCPLPRHEYGYTASQIKELLTEQEQGRLWKWMDGQTMCLTESGEGVVYTDDFRRWYALKDSGKEPVIFD